MQNVTHGLRTAEAVGVDDERVGVDLAHPIVPGRRRRAWGARAFVVTDEYQQTVDVRLNGVRAECTAEANSNILMAVKAGLKLTRNLAENAEADIAVVPMMTAILDPDDQVVSNDSFGYKNGFNTDLARLLPVVEFELVVPAGGRAVISLTPTR